MSKEKNIYPIKLVKFLSSSGIASRRKSFGLIMSGKVMVNDNVNIEPSFSINEDDIVKFNGKEIHLHKKIYIMLNKPRGYTCTADDPYAEKKAIDLINLPNYRLFNIGRLDKDSEGLILFTNDGNFSNKLMHPKHGIKKTYIVSLSKELSFKDIIEMTNGTVDSGETLKAKKIEKLSKNRYKFILNEGKKREIRRLVKSVGNDVRILKRIEIGNLKLENLPEGKWKYLSKSDLNKALGVR